MILLPTDFKEFLQLLNIHQLVDDLLIGRYYDNESLDFTDRRGRRGTQRFS